MVPVSPPCSLCTCRSRAASARGGRGVHGMRMYHALQFASTHSGVRSLPVGIVMAAERAAPACMPNAKVSKDMSDDGTLAFLRPPAVAF